METSAPTPNRLASTAIASLAFLSIAAVIAAIAILTNEASFRLLEARVRETALFEPIYLFKLRFAVSQWGFNADMRMIGVIVALFLLEIPLLGWAGSSLRRVLFHRSDSTRRDLLFYGLQLVNAMPFFTKIFTLGAVYVTGLFVNAVTSTVVNHDLRIWTGVPLVDMAVYLLVFSFVEYWDHRILHTAPFWRLHRMHHTATEMNLLTSGRNHPALFAFEPLLRVWVTALLGVPFEVLVFFPVIHQAHQHLSHSMLNWDWGWFGRWGLISPVAHRVHHSTNPEHFNRNFSNLFTIWDRLFGTWYAGTEQPKEFGLHEEATSPTARPMPILQELAVDMRQFVLDIATALHLWRPPQPAPKGPAAT